ncbi:hypothetical protein KIN20_009575 [Parelaphostrongylus tenuis]|uniref:RING-type domain-containing protein n=1 Tax=Parelaphostrongylus tenuis TaxID=148309 RepID=A0AAD5QLB4_PARTN|nr:hypothetical protein KIN20_009575 [Parelaphostrongylus tenuis]
MATMPPSESDNEVDQSFMSLDETRGSVDMPDDDDYQLDDTVVRSEEFGRCTICFEDIPYDPVGCLYCQQLIGCRRCVNRWYSGGLRMNTSEIYLVGECPPSNHKQCPLCRHEWEDQVEVTSMFNLVFN